ncbi:stress-induced-phosphoprotein 1-like [Porites lutea]|uniref:stress-induced-phosphoprotein 1-like n=1 Tax=Porites lutea TaxID=51062 RepID=UPI003CC54E5E
MHVSSRSANAYVAAFARNLIKYSQPCFRNYPDCLSDVKAATALQPSYLKAIIRGANTCLKLKQFQEAIIWCDKGLTIYKDNQELLEIKTCSIKEREKVSKQGGYKEATDEGDSGTIPKSLDCTSIAETHKNAGNDAFLKDDFVKAINLYTEGIEVKCKDDDLNAKLYNNRASAHYHLENYHDCLSDVKAATALQPSYFKAIIRGAKTCLKLKQLEETINWCEKGLAIDKDNQDLLEIKSCSVIEREKILTQEGDKAAKEEGDSRTNQKSLDCTSIAETHKNAGNDAFRKDDFVKAINLYSEGIKVKCNDADLNAKLYDNRASAHYHLGKVSFILTLRTVDIVLYFVPNIPLSILHPGPFT